jgi:hypothetical protein
MHHFDAEAGASPFRKKKQYLRKICTEEQCTAAFKQGLVKQNRIKYQDQQTNVQLNN